MAVGMATTDQVEAILANAQENDFETEYDEEAGIASIKFEGRNIYSALKKGSADAWIVRWEEQFFAM